VYVSCSDEDEIWRCLGALDEMLDLYDADDDYVDELYQRSSRPVDDNDDASPVLPLQSCARVAGRNLEIRKSMTTGLITRILLQLYEFFPLGDCYYYYYYD